MQLVVIRSGPGRIRRGRFKPFAECAAGAWRLARHRQVLNRRASVFGSRYLGISGRVFR